jgi:glycosyltransferase involved in cell wall biosynthesis
VAVFHDANMENFIWAACQSLPKLGALLESWPSASLALSDGRTLSTRAISFFAALSAGCVVHGPHYLKDVAVSCPGPTTLLPLCYPDIGTVPPAPDGSGTFVVVCFGMINPNKQPERILRALAADPVLRARGRMRFVGPIEDGYRARLAALAADLALAAPEFTGWIDDARLCALIAQAHLLCCLRHPITEGGSASVVTALYSARPVVVNDVGSYTEIPDGLVHKIQACEDPTPLAALMGELVRDPQAADTAAVRAAAYAREHYSADAYVYGLVPLLEMAVAGCPALEAARRMACRLAALGVGFGDSAAARIESRLARVTSTGKCQRARIMTG